MTGLADAAPSDVAAEGDVAGKVTVGEGGKLVTSLAEAVAKLEVVYGKGTGYSKPAYSSG